MAWHICVFKTQFVAEKKSDCRTKTRFMAYHWRHVNAARKVFDVVICNIQLSA